MNKETSLVDVEYLLEKFLGKGGWTYAVLPEILQNKHNPFGWVKVKGFVDDFELKQCKLMPMADGKLFLPLPVKAQIRKKIWKEAGDWVKVVFYSDVSPLEIPGEIIKCFKNEPQKIHEIFLPFTEGEQKTYIDWIYSAKTEDTKADRIVKMMNRLQRKLRFYNKEKT
ncbi:MAG: YdeI/OmpD-associated family protein [Flammeovirgaceae bacterium]|nr:YdeI/OmpD-associated family protein [Flammeovirgaceae bacterium]